MLKRSNSPTNKHASIASFTTSWRHFSRSLLLLVLLLGVLAGTFMQPARAASSETKVLPQLQNEAEANPDKDFRVIVSRVAGTTSADDKLKELGGTKVKDIPDEAFVAMVKGKKLAELSKDASVKYVTLDSPMRGTGTVDASKLATLYPQVARAAGLWSGSTPLTGAGIGVAVLDTGIQSASSDWKDASGNSRIAAQVLFNSNTKSMNDAHGHGTHVAGIIAGNSWQVTDTAIKGKYVGIAPEAKLINVKVSDDAGMSYISDVVTAIDWVINNRKTYNIRVMNLSLVSGTAESYTTSILDAAVERAWFNGIFVVVAAGNTGKDTVMYPPANDPFVMTVGAADPMGTVAQGDDTIAPWSSYGTTQDGFSKPEAVAPGRYMVSTLASGGSTLAKQFPDRIVDTNYLRLSGTSMAAPVVAGVAALAFQAHPEWTNDQVKWLLMNTATKLGTTTTTTDATTGTTTTTFTAHPGQGAGEIDAAKVATYSSAPGYANQGLTISPLLTTTDGTTTYTTDTTASWSTASWSTASWSTASWSTASWSTASWSTSSSFD